MVGIRQFIRPEIGASAIAHLSILALVFVYAQAHPFVTAPVQSVNVDIVTPDEIERKPDPWAPLPEVPADVSKSTKAPEPPAAAPAAQPTSPPQRQASRPNRKEAAARPQAEPSPVQAQPQQQAQPAPQTQPAPQVQAALQSQDAPPPVPPPAAAAAPAYAPPQPDITVKYNVMLGLPEALPPLALSADVGDKKGDGGDAAAKAEVSGDMVSAFRAHIKQCSKLPPSLSPSDDLMIKLRIMMTRDGRLATEPMVKEGTASLKAVDLRDGAVAALAACQPYPELPPDKYNEWKVIDLTFTPRDFSS